MEKKESQNITAYFKDSISQPEISVLLFIVDDSIKNPKKKRECVLNPKFKYIGISSTNYLLLSNINEDNKENQNNNDKDNFNNNSQKLSFCPYFSFK